MSQTVKRPFPAKFQSELFKFLDLLMTYLSRPEHDLIGLKDGVEAPNTKEGQAQMYVDEADGDLKIKFGDGTVKTITVDT